MAVVEADDHHAEVQEIAMIENSCFAPPCCVALEVNAPPTFPCNAPRIQRPPAWSRKLAICDDSRPKAGADDDCIVSSKVADLRDRSGLINLEVRVARDLIGYELGNASMSTFAPVVLLRNGRHTPIWPDE